MKRSARIKKMIVAAAVAGVAAIGVGVYFYTQHNLSFEPHGDVTVISIPFNLTATDGDWQRSIDTTPIEGATVPFRTGTRTVTFSSNGFASKTQDVTVTDGEAQTIYVTLEPVQGWAQADIENDEKYGTRSEDIAGYIVSAGGEQVAEEYPIVNKLPILDQWYEIQACTSKNEPALELGEIGVCANLALDNPTQRARIIESIKATGYDPADYTVIINGEVYKP